jgi:hypothetical protein
LEVLTAPPEWERTGGPKSLLGLGVGPTAEAAVALALKELLLAGKTRLNPTHGDPAQLTRKISTDSDGNELENTSTSRALVDGCLGEWQLEALAKRYESLTGGQREASSLDVVRITKAGKPRLKFALDVNESGGTTSVELRNEQEGTRGDHSLNDFLGELQRLFAIKVRLAAVPNGWEVTYTALLELPEMTDERLRQLTTCPAEGAAKKKTP